MFLAGYKTYIIAFIMIAKAIYGAFSGDTGMSMSQVDYDLMLNGMGLGALRAGVGKR